MFKYRNQLVKILCVTSLKGTTTSNLAYPPPTKGTNEVVGDKVVYIKACRSENPQELLFGIPPIVPKLLVQSAKDLRISGNQ